MSVFGSFGSGWALTGTLLLLGAGLPACSDEDDASKSSGASTACQPGEEGCESTGTGGTGGAPTKCLSGTHSEDKCSDCAAGEYCEPGSSAAGIKCLQLCDTSDQCCAPLTCQKNKWVSSYQGTICSTGGL